MNVLKLTLLSALTFAGIYSFADELPKSVVLDNQARYFGVSLSVHAVPCDREYDFTLNKSGKSRSKQSLPLPDKCFINRITFNKVIKQ